MRARAVRLLSLGVGLVLLAPFPAPVTGQGGDASDSRPFMKGMTVSAPRGGQIWGTDAMRASLDELKALGVEWVAIHPYARVDASGQVRARFNSEAPHLRRAVEIARDTGLRLFWKPHLAYWRAFEWRGTIEFGADEEAWSRFFDSYERFIVDQARFAEAAGVELFSIGLEFERTVHREDAWRRIIAAVRDVYTGRLTYAANWDGIDRVPFWDALDVIGVQGYFPLSHTRAPTREEVERGWDQVLARLRAISTVHDGKPILFTEIGYNRSSLAATEPWDSATDDSPDTRRLRRMLIETALERLEQEPVVAGLFWWKWIPGDPDRARDFSMRDPEAREVVRVRWGS